MGRFVALQSNFSVGEIDPLVRARLDLQQYYNACERGRNVLFLPQGGFRWRPGTRYAYELPATAADGVREVPFQFSVDDSYMLVFVNLRMYVFKDGALIENINGVADQDYLVTTIGSARLAEINWTQSADTLVLVEKDMTPFKLVRGASDALWTISAVSFDSIPKHAFTVTQTPVAQTLAPSATTGRVTLTAGGGTPFAAGNVGDYVNATPQGRARIVGYTSATVVSAVVEVPFFSTSIPSSEWEIETEYEAVWSVTRGYPRSCVFHEGRLYFGGSKSRPSTVWGSKVGFPFDFAPADGYADDAVENTIDSGRFNAIVDIISGRDLQIFTTGAEYYVPQAQGSPITPESFFFKGATVNGAKLGIRVQQLESGTLYIQREGKALQEFLYTDVELAYVSNKISLLSGHLLLEPKRMALRRATSTDEGDLLLITNDADGSMGAWMLLRSQNVIAPSLWTTDGEFLDIAVDVSDIYAVVKRGAKYYVEIFDLDLDTDCAFAGAQGVDAVGGGFSSGAFDMTAFDPDAFGFGGVTVSTTVSGIPYVGQVVDIILDGFVQAQAVVSAGGVVTFSRAPATSYEVGLPFTPEVVTMPAEPRLASGARVGFKKRIPQVNVMVMASKHLTVNGQQVPFQHLGAELLDQPTPEFTGTKRVAGLLGWSQEAQITFSRDVPLPATVLGVDYRVAVHGGT